jgi:hypothetical protein
VAVAYLVLVRHMKPLSAIIFGFSAAGGAAVAEIWRVRVSHGEPAELGLAGSLIGLALFALLYALTIYCCALALHFLHRDRELIAAYIACAIVGAPFWWISLRVHALTTRTLRFPDKTWLPEVILLCVLSFEVIRLIHIASTRLTKRSSQPLTGE